MRLSDLLDEYEDRRDRGEAVAPEDLCRDCPELLRELKRKIAALESLDQRLGGGPVPAPAQAGRYRAIELHARGGLGEVFRAFDEELKREVALKRIQAWLDRDPDQRARFLREAEITGRLEHPGIVPVYGLGHDERGRPYYAMRFVRGETMDEAIAKRTAMTSLVRRFLSVCQTIAYAHSKGVVHRDLKPSNLLLGPFGETLVVDWGLAKPWKEGEGRGEPPEPPPIGTPEATLPGEHKGSPAYMSPEQARGDIAAVGPQSDVFGLGATLYKILSGRPPFGGVEMAKHADAPPLPHDAPKALAAICRKAMRPLPAERYASALEMAEDVERWLAGEPVRAWREPFDLRLRRWMRRHRALVTAGAAAVAVAAVSLAVLAAQQRTSNVSLSAANARTLVALADAERQRDRAEEVAYRIAIMGAERELLAGRPAAAEEFLDACVPASGRPDLRGLEWDLLKRRTRPEALRFRVETVANGLAFAGPDSLVVGPGRTVKLDAPGAAPVAVGPRFEAMSDDGSVWAEKPVGRTVVVVHRPDGDVTLETGDGFAWIAAISPDGRRLATIKFSGELTVWDARDGRALGTLPPPAGMGREFSARHVLAAFSPDGKALALLIRWETAVEFHRRLSVVEIPGMRERFAVERVEDGLGMATIEEATTCWRQIVWSPDGSRLAFPAYDFTLRVHDALTGEPQLLLRGHDGLVLTLAFLPDGERLVSAGADRTVRLWHLLDGFATVLGAHDGPVVAVAASADGRRVASAAPGMVKVWDLVPAQRFRAHAGAVNDIDIGGRGAGEGGGAIATGGAEGGMRLWDGRTSGLVAETQERGHVFLRFLPGGGRLVVGGMMTLALVEPPGVPVDLIEPQPFERVVALEASPDGRRLACAIASYAGSDDLRVIDTETRAAVWRATVGSVSRLAISPDGKTLYCVSETMMELPKLETFDFATGKPLGSEEHVDDIAIRPDGKQIARLLDRRIELSAGGQKLDLEPPAGTIARLLFHPDGSRLVAVANDTGSRERGILAVYDTANGRKLVEVHGDGAEFTASAFARDGSMLVTGDASGAVRIWDLRRAR